MRLAWSRSRQDALVPPAGEVIRDGAGYHTTRQSPTFGGDLFNALTGSADLGLRSIVLAIQLCTSRL